MSFGDFDRKRSGEFTMNITQSDNEEFTRLCSTISSNIFQISSNVTAIQNIVSLVGSAKDSQEIRQRMHSLTDSTSQMAKKTSEEFKRLNTLVSANTSVERERKVQQAKLSKDFQMVLRRFQAVEKTVAEKSREFVSKAKMIISHSNDDEEGDEEEQVNLLNSNERRQQMAEMENEIEFNESLIAEREQDIQEIEVAITEVNEIFRDLGTLVNEQQYLIDNIEANIESTAVRTQAAVGELSSASRLQRSARSKKCWLLLILTVIAVIIVLIIYATTGTR